LSAPTVGAPSFAADYVHFNTHHTDTPSPGRLRPPTGTETLRLPARGRVCFASPTHRCHRRAAGAFSAWGTLGVGSPALSSSAGRLPAIRRLPFPEWRKHAPPGDSNKRRLPITPRSAALENIVSRVRPVNPSLARRLAEDYSHFPLYPVLIPSCARRFADRFLVLGPLESARGFVSMSTTDFSHCHGNIGPTRSARGQGLYSRRSVPPSRPLLALNLRRLRLPRAPPAA